MIAKLSDDLPKYDRWKYSDLQRRRLVLIDATNRIRSYIRYVDTLRMLRPKGAGERTLYVSELMQRELILNRHLLAIVEAVSQRVGTRTKKGAFL